MMSAQSAARAGETVVVVGAGWAGLAAAVELAAAGRHVTLLDAAPVLGGRARSLEQHEHHLDNGQHLLLGAYSGVLSLLRTMGVAERDVLDRRALALAFYDAGEWITLNANAFPAPWHVGAALLTARGLSVADKLRALLAVRQWQRTGFIVDPDITVAQWLRDHPPAVTRILWEPLCVAALSTPIEHASAAQFARVLRDAFTGHRTDSDLLFATQGLGAVLPQPAARFVAARGGDVRCGVRVRALAVDADRVTGVVAGEELIAAQHVIVAVPPAACIELLDPHSACRDIATHVRALESEAITTLYAQFDDTLRLPQPLTGMVNTLTQWVFDHGYWERPGLLALVNSGNGPHVAWPKERLMVTMIAELRLAFPELPVPRSVHMFRDKRAALSCTPESAQHRPGTLTPVHGLVLAGDYTDTGYPSTLEGAVRSGIAAARAIM